MPIERAIARLAAVAVAVAIALQARPSQAQPARSAQPAPSFTCADLKNARIKGWKATIQISFEARAERTGSHYRGEASYTAYLGNQATLGAAVSWPGFTDSWHGDRKTGAGSFRAELFRAVITGGLALLNPTIDPSSPGAPRGMGIDVIDALQVDTRACRYGIHVGAAMAAGDAAAIAKSGIGVNTVGFSASIPPQQIPASAKQLAGSVTMSLPRSRYDLLDSFYYTCHAQDCAREKGSASIAWTLVPELIEHDNEEHDDVKIQIEGARLFDLDDTPLRFFSASPCPASYCGGNPRVKATLAVSGEPMDALAEVALDVVERGAVVATGSLVPAARTALLRDFGPGGRIEVTAPLTMFQFSDGALAGIDPSRDARLELRVRARSAKGAHATVAAANVYKLVLYTNGNRYFPRDANKGGDGWVKPSVKPVYESFGGDYLWSDFSNMHGGSFYPPHKSHQTGNDVDGIFRDDALKRDWQRFGHHTAETARRLLELVNDPVYGKRVICAFLTFKQRPADAFWMAIKDVTLRDGRKATNVILSQPGHETHVHLRVVDAGDPKKYTSCAAHIVDGAP